MNTLTVKAIPKSIEDITEFANKILEQHECPVMIRTKISVVIDEIVSNVCSYAYPDDNGNLTDSFIVEASGDLCGLNVPQGQWHSLECLESGSVIIEAKDGVWEPLSEEDIIETYNNPK